MATAGPGRAPTARALLLRRVKAANAGANEHAHFIAIYFFEIEAGIFQRLVSRGNSELRVAIRAPDFLRRRKCGVGSKFFTSAASSCRSLLRRTVVMRSIPALARKQVFPRSSIVFPMGDTTPRPVITTLRSDGLAGINKRGSLAPQRSLPRQTLRLLLLRVFDVFDHIADGLQLLRFFIGNFVAEFLFQRHDQLRRCRANQRQVLDELGVRCHLNRR